MHHLAKPEKTLSANFYFQLKLASRYQTYAHTAF